jgi:peptide-methionine (S)-S-oxide reductase
MKLSLLAAAIMSTALASAADPKESAPSNVAIVGGGCFWCVESTYKLVPGIKKLTSGYSAGQTKNPTYEDICTGETGHAEVVRVDFDPAVISYRKVLDLFFEMHDPTTVTKEEMMKEYYEAPKGQASDARSTRVREAKPQPIPQPRVVQTQVLNPQASKPAQAKTTNQFKPKQGIDAALDGIE